MQERRFEWIAVIAGAIAFLCLVSLAAKVTVGETMRFDEAVRAAVHSAASPALTLLFQWVTLLGSQAVVLSVPVVAALVLFRQGRSDRALLALIAVGGAELLEFVLKHQFQRQRPEPFFDALRPESYSFPSGHTLLSFCCYGTLAALASSDLRAALRWLVRIAAAALILAIGISRVYLGVHYPTDVIAGYLTGVVWLAGVAILYRRLVAIET
jgi:undecaprenyl-diphosphatase